jgi:SAM-dependent methyltransferase
MLFFAALFAFLVLHARSQPLFLPVRDYHHFVGGVTTWAARRVLQTSAFTYVGSELELFKEATHWKRYYAKQLRPFITGDVLEVGAGIGATTRVLCHGEENSWTCLEPDGAMTERLRASLTTDPLAVEARAVCGTLADLGATEQFDTLLYIDVLEHIEDDRAELVAASGRLKPGGHLIVLAPAHNWLFSPFDRAIGHFRRYSKASLLAAAPPELRLVRAFYLDSVGMMASAANRAFLKASSPTRRQIRLWDSAFVPTSRVVDSLLAHRVGKTVVAIWTLPRAAERVPYLRAESA